MKTQLPSSTDLNHLNSGLPRLVSSTLKQRDGLWYWQALLFTGYMYHIINQRQVEAFYVEQGVVMRPYVPELLASSCAAYGLAVQPIIDISGFNSSSFCAHTQYGQINMPYYCNGMTYDGALRLMVDDRLFTGMAIETLATLDGQDIRIRSEVFYIDGQVVASQRWSSFFGLAGIYLKKTQHCNFSQRLV